MSLFEMFMYGYQGQPWRIESKNEEVIKQLYQLIDKYKIDEEKKCLKEKNIKLELSFFEKKVIEDALKLYYYYIDGIQFKDEFLIENQFDQLQKILNTSSKIENLCFKVKEQTLKKILVDKTKMVSDDDLPF